MNWDWTLWLTWLVRTVLGGSLLLLLVWVLGKAIRQPARRQRWAETGVLAALTLAVLSLTPSWLVVSLPITPAPALAGPSSPGGSPPPQEFAADAAGSQASAPDALAGHAWLSPGVPVVDVGPSEGMALSDNGLADSSPSAAEVASPSALPASSVPLPRFSRDGLAFGLITMYLGGVVFGLSRWLLGYIGLWRLLRTSIAPPLPVAQVFAAMTRDQAGRPRLRMSHRLRVPVSCGLFRPTVVLPASLCQSGQPATLRWVFAHELTHLRRGDAWSGLLFALGGVVFFYCPWFWWLRRQVRLCQEYVADAAAVDQDARTEDYAQFLLNLATAPAGPVLAIGVLGPSSDLFRRITMLLHAPLRVENHCPRPWALAMTAGLLAVAVLASGLGLRAAAPVAPVSDQTDESPAPPAQKEEPKKDKRLKKLPTGTGADIDIFDAEEALGALLALDDGPGVPPDTIDALQKALDSLPKGPEMDKAREELRKAIDRLKERRNALPRAAVGRFGAGQGLRMMPGAPGGVAQFGRRPRLGARVEKPSAALTDQLNLSQGQGVVINEVLPDSAAAKAGLKASDILLEIDGKLVPNDPQEFHQIIDGIKANTPVDAVVLRKGKKETVKGLSLPEAPAEPRFRRPGAPGGFGGAPGQPGAPALPGAPAAPRAPRLPPAGGGQPPRAGAAAPANPAVPAAPAFPGFAPPGGANNFVMTSVFRTDDRFTTRHQEGNLVITLTGTVADGKAKVSEIHVQDGTETATYKSVDKVPERYRDKVKNLAEMSDKGRIKVESRSPEIE
jgi:hypothetical protein